MKGKGFQIYGWGIGGSKSSQKENYNRSYKHFEGEMHNMKPFTLFEINSQQIQVANNARIQDLIGKSKIYSLTGSLEPYIDILAYQQQQEIIKCLNDVNNIVRSWSRQPANTFVLNPQDVLPKQQTLLLFHSVKKLLRKVSKVNVLIIFKFQQKY